MSEKTGQKLIDIVESHDWWCECMHCDKYWQLLEENTHDGEVSEEFDEVVAYEITEYEMGD